MNTAEVQFSDPPIILSSSVPQGQFIVIGKPVDQIIAGSRPFSEAELIVRRIAEETFGKEWLKSIGAWQYSTGEIIEMMRGES